MSIVQIVYVYWDRKYENRAILKLVGVYEPKCSGDLNNAQVWYSDPVCVKVTS